MNINALPIISESKLSKHSAEWYGHVVIKLDLEKDEELIKGFSGFPDDKYFYSWEADDRRNRVLGIVHISSGGFSGTDEGSKIIFAAALKSCASGIILCHCHPSGKLDPSMEDRSITNKLKGAVKILDLEILDHLIISKDEYYSFTDEGIL